MRRLILIVSSILAAGCAPTPGTPGLEGAAGGKGDQGGPLDVSEFDFPDMQPGEYYASAPRDALGVPFIGTVLGMRDNGINEEGVNNFWSLPFYARRFATIAQAYGPELETMGFDICASVGEEPELDNYGNGGGVGPDRVLDRGPWSEVLSAPSTLRAFAAVIPCLFQRVSAEPFAPLTLELFTPDYLTVDFRTDGSFPFGRRPDDQIASKFFGLLLDLDDDPDDPQDARCGKLSDTPKSCTIDSLQDPALYQTGRPAELPDGFDELPAGHGAFPLHPAENDVPYPSADNGFAFPYLAAPHGGPTYAPVGHGMPD